MIHTKEESLKFMEIINDRCIIKFVDASWHNDLADSISNEDKNIVIWFPNIKQPELENINGFQIQLGLFTSNTPTYISQDGKNIFSIDEVIEWVNKTYKK